jgi:hypothetical protein
MRRLSAADVHASGLSALGLDASALDLTSVEAIAAAVRRAASFQCPCSAATLIRTVVGPLRGLVSDLDATKVLVEETLEAVVAHGDLLEQRDIDTAQSEGGPPLLYAAPPSFVPRKSGAVILLGIALDRRSALPSDLDARIDYSGHTRRISPIAAEDLRARLLSLELIELSPDAWLRSPVAEPPSQLIARFNVALESSQPSLDVPGLLILDPERPVRYYRGRWVEVGRQTGRFVARRRQAYGAQLWSYIHLRDGNPERRGCDEAWHLQMAIDAMQERPQRFRLRPGPGDTSLLDFFSPVPMWAKRRWNAVGGAVQGTGSLFSYRIQGSEVHEEVRFARERLWLAELTGSEK